MKKIVLLAVLIGLSSLTTYGQTMNMGTTGSTVKLLPEQQRPFFQRQYSNDIPFSPLTCEQIIHQISPKGPKLHEQKFSLDSVVYENFNCQNMLWANNLKKEFAYDVSGRLSQALVSEWDQAAGVWKPKQKESYTYDGQGNTIMHSMHEYNYQYQNWTGNWKLEQQFNALGLITQRTWFSWASWISDWVPELKTNYQYDWNDALIMISCDLWNITSNQWCHDYREDFSYDPNDKLVQHLMSGWDVAAGQWVPVRRTMFNYNIALELNTLIHEVFNPGTAQWIGEYRHEYQWNGMGLLTEDLYAEWRNTTSQWELKTKTENQYNSAGKPVETICSVWKYGTQWIGSWKEEFDYTALGSMLNYRYYEFREASSAWILSCKCEAMSDSYGNQLQKKWFFWDQSLNQWTGTDYAEYVYQYNFPTCQTAFPTSLCDELDSFCHVPQTALHYDWNSTIHSWEFKNMATYFCSVIEIIGVAENPIPESASLFPNPATTYVKVNWPKPAAPFQLMLLNSTGAVVLMAESTSGEEIQISHLPKGLYFYQARSKAEKSNGTLLIQ